MNKIKAIIIANIAETHYRTYRKSNPEDAKQRIEYDLLEGERGLYYTTEPKVVITSFPIEKTFLNDIKNIMRIEIQNIYPENPTERICHNVAKEEKLLKQVIEVIQSNPGIHIIPYYATPEFFDLLSVLRQRGLKFTTPETIAPKNQFIHDHFNCKVGFRKLWEKANDENSYVKIPQGFIVDDIEEAIEAAWWFYQNKRDFVIKYNRGTSGFGVVFYHCKDLPKNEKEFKKYIKAKHTDKMWFEDSLVVEELIDIDTTQYGGSPSPEFRISDDIKHTYNSVQRLGPNSYFEGVMMSKEIENMLNFDLERAADSCLEFCEALKEFGYRGILDVDLVIDKKHNIYAVESNIRRNGGSHVYETACHLLGRNFAQHYIIASKDNLVTSKNITTYKDLRKRVNHLYYDHDKKEGVIPAINSFLKIGSFGYIVIAKNLKRMTEIEEEFARLVQAD